MAYLLGLIIARGTLTDDTVKSVSIEFSFSGLQAVGLSSQTTFNQPESIHAFFSRQLVPRITEMSEGVVRVTESKRTIILSINFLRDCLFWQNIRRLTGYKTSFLEFEVPTILYGVREDIQKEFVRGFADAAGYVRKGNADLNGLHRIFIHVAKQNWKLPVQLCHLIQDHLHVPVNMIDWGHPNLRAKRDPDDHTWWREHQIRIYADSFSKIGLYLTYRQRALEELANANKKIVKSRHAFCCPSTKTRIKTSVPHPDENSQKIHPNARGHFEAYWQICQSLGCVRK
jgi:hypothetical protein